MSPQISLQLPFSLLSLCQLRLSLSFLSPARSAWLHVVFHLTRYSESSSQLSAGRPVASMSLLQTSLKRSLGLPTDQVPAPRTRVLKAAKYEIQKTSTCRATLFCCSFLVNASRFSPRVINLAHNKNIYCKLRKVVAKIKSAGLLWATKFGCFSVFMKLATCHATNQFILASDWLVQI